MPARSRHGFVDPAAGWRALAAAVARPAADLGLSSICDAVPAGGPGHWPGWYASVSVGPTGGPRPGGREGPVEPPGPPDVPVPDEHAQTWRLVAAAQAGNGEAFGQLYDSYVDMVYRFVYFRVNDRTLAEDFTSETFLRALRRIGSISYQGRDIGAWFITIARNIVFDHSKSARARLEVPTSEPRNGDDGRPGPEDTVLDALTSDRLMAAVRALGEEQRECVLLRFIQGFSVSETATVMGKNEGAIKALQYRAVRKLAELIGDELL
jgi:RNA polymerase sigma-70 factor (ECF subfamily)